MMTIRYAIVMCVILTITCEPIEPKRATAQDPAAADSHPRSKVLERFVGAWDLKSTQQPSKWHPEGGEFTGKESTVWALKNRIIMIRDTSRPDGKKGLYISTYDPRQNAYPFWCFDSNGLLGTQWLLKWNAEADAAIGRSIGSPPAWTSGGQNRFPDPDTNLVSYWMRDENGVLLMEFAGRKDRLPAEREAAIVAAWEKHEPADDLPVELKILDRMIGDWDAVSTMKPAEWTPDGGHSTMKVKRQWILNGRFMMDTPIHANGQEGLTIIGFDPNKQIYQGWRFTSEGEFPRSPFKGSWDAKSQTLSYVGELGDGKTNRTSVRLSDRNREAWQIKVTDDAGKVYFDTEIVATRRTARDNE